MQKVGYKTQTLSSALHRVVGKRCLIADKLPAARILSKT